MAKSVPPKLDPQYLQFATPRQKVAAEAYIETGSYVKAAKRLGINHTSVQTLIERLKRTAARRGFHPEGDATKVTIPGQYLKGISTLYNRDGDITQQWVLQRADQEVMLEIAKEMAEAFFTEREPLPTVKPPKQLEERLVSILPICDVHIGCLADQEETGDANYDCKIATDILTGCVTRLLSRVPYTKHAVLALLGDICHYDGPSPVTARGGNVLDTDTRYWKVARVAFALIRQVLDQALTKFGTIHVVSVAGNHDPISGVWLEIALAAAYANNPRLTFDFGPRSLKLFTHGVNMVGFAHGHEKKFAQLGELLIADYPEEAHRTERLILTGHIHHEKSHESRLARIQSFRTLAPKDAWHAHSGYRSGRDLKAIVLHDKYGEVERHTVSVRELD